MTTSVFIITVLTLFLVFILVLMAVERRLYNRITNFDSELLALRRLMGQLDDAQRRRYNALAKHLNGEFVWTNQEPELKFVVKLPKPRRKS